MRTKLITFFFLILTLPSIFAQSQIEGAVSNKVGEELVSVRVILVDVSTQTVLFTTQTDSTGLFKVTDIPPGAYEIKCSLATYKTVKIEYLYFPKDRDKYIGLTLEAEKISNVIPKETHY